MSTLITISELEINDLDNLYSIYKNGTKECLLNNFYYPNYNIKSNLISIDEYKLNLRYNYVKKDKNILITLFSNKEELKTYTINENLFYSYILKYGKNKINKDILVFVLAINLFITREDLHYIFNPKIYNLIKPLDFSLNLMDNINSLFYSYGSLNYYEHFFEGKGNLFNMDIKGGNYFITILNDTKIFNEVINLIKTLLNKSYKILLIGIYYPIKVNNKSAINTKEMKKLKNNMIKKFSINSKYYYDFYDRTKFYDNSTFELAFFINQINESTNKNIIDKYEKYLEYIENLKISLK